MGRDREIAALEDAYARSVEEPGANAVLVTAPAGVGKIPYDPAGDPEKRKQAVGQWKALIPEGSLPPK